MVSGHFRIHSSLHHAVMKIYLIAQTVYHTFPFFPPPSESLTIPYPLFSIGGSSFTILSSAITVWARGFTISLYRLSLFCRSFSILFSLLTIFAYYFSIFFTFLTILSPVLTIGLFSFSLFFSSFPCLCFNNHILSFIYHRKEGQFHSFFLLTIGFVLISIYFFSSTILFLIFTMEAAVLKLLL